MQPRKLSPAAASWPTGCQSPSGISHVFSETPSGGMIPSDPNPQLRMQRQAANNRLRKCSPPRGSAGLFVLKDVNGRPVGARIATSRMKVLPRLLSG